MSQRLISLHSLVTGADAQEALRKRQEYLRSLTPSSEAVWQTPFDVQKVSTRNCENLVGSVAVPLGIAGPVQVLGDVLEEEVFLPLATTEGALVASINRGSKALNMSGGATVLVERRGMTRSPVFECPSGAEAQRFLQWFESNIDHIREIAERTSSHLKLLTHHAWIRGRHVYIRFAFDTDDAMGMNMVTIALQEALSLALKKRPEIKLLSLSSNVCTDKKDSQINALLGRGYWVQAEAFLSAETLHSVLKSQADRLLRVHVQKNLVGSNIAGSESQNAHVANALSAFFIATGQDPAHVVDGSRASLTIEAEKNGLYVALTLPSINVGTIGGGTGLEAQMAARALIAPGKNLTAPQLAAVVGVAALAGELSLLASLAENTLAVSHRKLGRGESCGQ